MILYLCNMKNDMGAVEMAQQLRLFVVLKDLCSVLSTYMMLYDWL